MKQQKETSERLINCHIIGYNDSLKYYLGVVWSSQFVSVE